MVALIGRLILPPESPEGDLSLSKSPCNQKTRELQKNGLLGGESVGGLANVIAPPLTEFGRMLFWIAQTPFQVNFLETMIFCGELTHLKQKPFRKQRKSGFKPIKMSSYVFYVMKIAINRDIRPFNASLIYFMRLGEGFCFSIVFCVPWEVWRNSKTPQVWLVVFWAIGSTNLDRCFSRSSP